MDNTEAPSTEPTDELAEYMANTPKRRVLVTREGLRYTDGTKPKGISE